ncbi:hypothetical protein MAR_013487 [Mya arenaria]|uniref:Chitin-binding type-2 domain-containing protein n=1 Tax=Mya arenaria TaxID=6604 RepID=A0ABY7G000_MYAAR|nr:hypothetical protein MAR_013487 [Mya arenaria]
MKSVNISTNALGDDLHNVSQTIKHVSLKLLSSNNTLQNLPLFDINIESVSTNDSYSIQSVVELVNDINDTLITVQKDLNMTDGILSQSQSTSDDVQKELDDLDMIVSRFKKVERNLYELENVQNILTENSTSLFDLLLISKASVDANKKNLDTLNTIYKDFDFNSSKTENLIDRANVKVGALLALLKVTEDELNKTNDDLDGMQYRLFEFNDNKEILNKTLAEIKQEIIGKRQSHEHVNTTLHDILGDIPTLQITLANISSLVDEMNTSLINEKDKSLLKDKQLPKLLERYQQIDLTIDMTNKTLQKMANEIQDLKKHVDELKLRMDTYSTINISSTDIQKQIKHLEDQLAIMNGHYGNTEEVINKLRDTIDKHNVLGKNISTENVQEQYDDFNKTMNMVGEVLKKIEYESYVMEDHFNSLNDTIQKTNSALDDFSDQVQSSNIIKESIDGIGGQIQLNKDQVQNMKEVIDNMTDSYNDMQQKYENVLDTVATNNTIVRKLIKTAGENVGNIATILNSLEQQYNESVEHFFKMNGTLFDNVSEYFDLKRILNQVQLMEDKLQETITSLEKGIAGTSKESSQLTDSLSDLDSLVNSLNDTLHFEQLKYDFLRNNFKTLDSKLKGLLSPITDAKSKISGVSENVQNVLKFVHNVSDMMNKIPNINIPLSDFLKSIDVYTTNVNNASAKTNDIEREYKDLRLKSLDLTDSTKNITEIRHIYSEINTTLDTLQEELETVKDSMNGTNTNATSIEQQMKLLNSSLDEFNELDRKIVNISADFNNSRQNIKTLKDHIAVLDTSADELQQSLQNMKALYDIVDDVSLQKELLDLIEQIKNNSDYIQNIRTGFNNVSDILIGAETVFKDTNAKLHGSIDKFDTLNSVINHTSGAFNSTSRVIVDIDETTSGLFLGVDGIDTTLKKIRTKMSELNKTMEEEKKKREFIKEMFPKIKSKFHLISEQLNNTIKGLTQVDGFVRKSENTFGDVKGRIDMLDSIQIPLNDEKDAIETMQSSVNKSKSEINHVTDILHALDLDQLADTTVSFDKLERLYEKFRNETREAGVRLQVVNDSTEIVSRTNSRVADVLVDVNNTLDNFVKMETILDSTLDTSSQLSQQIGKTNRSINNMNDELVEIDSLLKGILSQFSHIQDPKLLATKEDLQNIMVSQRGQLDSLLTSIGGINAENAGIVSDISLMNDSISSTKLLLKELKEHIQTVNSTSSSVMNTINKTDEAHMALNSTASQMPPEMKRLMDNIVALQKKYKKEQEKLDFIAKNKPILQGDFTDLKPLFDDVNTNLSHTDISLSNLKQKIQRVDERLNTFKPLEITTATEMKLWDTMDNRKKQFHETFTLLTTKYKAIAEKINQLDDRNGTIDDIKKTFKSLNESLKAIEKHLQELEQNFTNIHLEESKVDETLNNLKETMNSFAKLQESSSNAGGRLETLKSTMDSTSAGLQSTNAGLNKVNSTLDRMKSNYAVLKNKTWEGKLPQFKTKLNADKGEVKKTQDQLNTLSGKVNTTEDEFQNVYRGLTKATYTRDNVTKSIENMSKTLSGVDSNLALLPKELNSIKADNDNQKKKVVEFQQDINNLDEKLKDELQKFQFVNQHLDPIKEKHSKTNVNFFANKPNMEEMGAKLDELFRIINKIKNKLIDFGLTDTDSSVKAWDVKIIKLNNTVNSIIDNNKLSEEKLNELKRILWDTKPLYRTEEPLAELEKRFEGYNKTLDAIAAAAHTIKIKLNDLGNEAERVIGELVERDMVLTTTPATTTPSGPPDWLTVKSSGTGTIGRDSGFVRCTVGDMTQWEMMKITRLQPDGREVPIAAWKQGFDDICNKVRYQGTISHPYTPHKYIVCGKALNIMECPGNTCYDHTEENCVTCKGGAGRGGDPCQGQSLFSYVAHETDCKKFYICMGPNKSVKKCAKGYFAPNVPGNCVMTYAKSSCGLKRG